MLFDGECVMCNGFVDFCIDHKPRCPFKVAALDSEVGRWLCRVHGVALPPSSFVYIEEVAAGTHHFARSRALQKSDAALHSLSALTSSQAWIIMMVFEPAPKAVRDLVYDLGWRYRRAYFGTTACRRRAHRDLEPRGELMHTCELSLERRRVLGDGCARGGRADSSRADKGDEAEDEWQGQNVLMSTRTLVYDAGVMRRVDGREARQARQARKARPAPPPVVSASELSRCRRLALEAAAFLDGLRLGGSEATGGAWAPFFICSLMASRGNAMLAEDLRVYLREEIDEERVRHAFGGCLRPSAPVIVEALDEGGAWWAARGEVVPTSDEEATAQWRALLTWLHAHAELRRPSWVAIGEESEEHRLRLVVALTPAGSLVGVCAVEVRTQ